jgi:hypothetical protein
VFWRYFSTVLDLRDVTIVPHVMPVPDGVAVPHPLGHHHQELVQLNRSVLVLREGPFKLIHPRSGTLIKKKTKLSSYKEIQMGSGAKSFMRKGSHEEMRKFFPYMRNPLVIYD